MEGYLHDHRRRALEHARAEYLEVEKYIAASDRHKRHEKKYPGQTARLLQEADKELQRAEWFLQPGQNPPNSPSALLKESTQKIAFEGINSALRTAYRYMLQAYENPSAMLGQETSRDRAKGANTVNRKRRNALAPLFELLARHRDGYGDYVADYVRPSELWPILGTHLDNMNLHPREAGTGTAKQYDYENGTISYENFRKSIRRIRKGWDNA